MTFQAYLDTIKAKTGLDPDDFRALAEKKGFLDAEVKVGTIVAWLKDDFDLGPGHAMAIVSTLGKHKGAGASSAEKIAHQFAGTKSHWRSAYDALLARTESFGPIAVMPTNTYVSLVKKGKKFAIVAVTAGRLDVGVKLTGVDSTGRLESAGSWNDMVTHRVRVTDPAQLDDELFGWLRFAYDGV
jgi:hypothetical protein